MQLVLDFPIIPRYSFANYVVCTGNETAFRLTQRLSDPVGAEKLLYLYGLSGSGKTHLLEACAEAMAKSLQLSNPLPIFSFRETPGVSPQTISSLLHRRFHGSPALLLDDIHLIPPDHSVKVQLWQMFNDYHGSSRPVVITGKLPPKELPNLDDHLVSRLLWGLVGRVDVSDDESRRMIMQKLANDRQILLSDDLIIYLLRHLPRDIPTLIETLDKIVHHALATGRKVSLRLASELLSEEEISP